MAKLRDSTRLSWGLALVLLGLAALGAGHGQRRASRWVRPLTTDHSDARRDSGANIGVTTVAPVVVRPISVLGKRVAPSKAQVAEAYGKLPLAFEPNRGQADPEVKFLSRGRGYLLFLTSTEAVVRLASGRDGTPGSSRHHRRHLSKAAGTAALRIKLVGANPAPEVAGIEELPHRSNYLIGNDPAKWRTDLPNYARVEYREVYPGIGLVYYGSPAIAGQLEYDFVVSPGASPNAIRLAVEGADKVQLNADGDLVLLARAAEVRFRRPLVYQESGGRRQEVSGAYRVRGQRQVGFELGAYDRSRPLVIDPVLSYSTYLGGTDSDGAYRGAVDASGNAYVTGSTKSQDFPTANAFQGGRFGSSYEDVFVTKLNPAGTAPLYSTYIGGGGTDYGTGIAVDSGGSAYITGRTDSSNFPTTPGAFKTGRPGYDSTFVLKLNSSGNALIYATYLGGSSQEQPGAIAVDAFGSAWVTGDTYSNDFPTTPGALRKTGSGYRWDAFVTRLNATGSELLYSTYLGGTQDDHGNGIALDSAGDAYVTGGSASSDFPTTVGALQTAFGGGASDAFVTKLTAAGALLYSTYVGGNGDDGAESIAVDSSGSAYVTGQTSSTNFPRTQGTFQPGFGGGDNDAFVTRLNATGTSLVYSTYLGGRGSESGQAIAVDSSGFVFVTGWTNSSNFPTTTDAYQAAFAGGGGWSNYGDAFLTKLDATATSLLYSTYLGGKSDDVGNAVAVDSFGDAYVAGWTQSTGFPSTSGAFRTSLAGGSGTDAFITKVAGTKGSTGCQVAEPALNISLAPGFYIAEVRTTPGAKEGYWGMEVLAPRGLLSGGFNLGGGVEENGATAGFGAFYLPGNQTVRIRMDMQVLPGGDASKFSMAVRLLNASRQQIGTDQLGTQFVQFDRALTDGFYIVEVRTAAGAPRATFQLGLGANAFSGGVNVGGFVASGLVGFGAFYIPESQEVRIKTQGLPTFAGVGASCLQLTLLDANRKVIRTVP